MSWHINYIEDSRIIEITYSGDVTGQDLREATEKRISMQRETGTNLVLADASQSQGEPHIIDVYNLPEKVYPEHNVRRDTRIAFVLPTHSKAKELAQFFKTAAKNRGWIIELFEKRKDALSWLTGEKSTEPHPG